MYTYWTDTAATKFTAQVKHQTASYEESNKLVNFCWCDSQNIAQYLTSAAVAPEELFLLERNILIVKEMKVIKTLWLRMNLSASILRNSAIGLGFDSCPPSSLNSQKQQKQELEALLWKGVFIRLIALSTKGC